MFDTMSTYMGLKVNPLEVKESDILIEDIAHALSLLCRGGGHLQYFYSVAQHSINCANEAISNGYNNKVILACLLHDASEAYISDIIRPVKKHLSNYYEIEENIMKVVFFKYSIHDLTLSEQCLIRDIDDQMLENELAQMMRNANKDVIQLKSYPDFKQKNYRDIEQEFLYLFNQYKDL